MANRRDFLGLAALGLLSPRLARGQAQRLAAGQAASRPNLILIFADDLGYGTVGCQGGTLAPTPAIDSLAAEGVRCTDGYVTAPVCAPSRCGLMAGAYNQRFGMQWNEDQYAGRSYTMPPEHRLLPQTLKAAGYATGHIGKWNIAADVTRCFDEAYAVMDWEADYFPDETGHYHGVDSATERASSKRQGILGPERADDEYLTDRLGRHAVEFVEKHRAEPFFLYLAFNAVHTPLQAEKALQTRFAHLQPPLDHFAAMLAALDENVGRLLAKLKETGLEENTLVVFIGDNGPARAGTSVWPEGWPRDLLLGSAGPLSGHKAQFREGGIRVPFLLRWPARLRPQSVYRQPVSAMDVYATFVAAAGAAVPAETRLDGANLLPYLAGEQPGAPHDILFWKNGDDGAVRRGDWKLLLSPKAPRVQLFNLAEDIAESKDLSAEQPERAKALHEAWLAWAANLPPRANPPRPPGTPQTPQDRGALFGAKDVNGDGRLSREEFLANQADQEAARQRLANWDLDKDGALSREEFVGMGRRPNP